MNDAHRSLDRVEKEDRQAICGENSQGVTLDTGNQSIPFFQPKFRRLLRISPKYHDSVTLNLLDGYQRKDSFPILD
jgi:hypothetical protein